MAKFDPYLEWLGIPSTERPPTLYQLLGVDPSITDLGEVKSLAIQRIAKVRHFQRGEHGDVCARLLEELSIAEATLTNLVRRAQYDAQLAEVAVRLKPIDEASKQAQSPVAAARFVNERLTSAKVIAVPATIPATPAPKRKKRSSRRNRNAQTVKWIIAASVGVVVLIGGVVANRMMSKPNMAATPSADVPVPEIAVVKVEPKPQPAPVVAVKPITAVYRPIPNDAVAAITFGRGTLGLRAPDYVVETDEAGLAAGIEVTFSKPGYLPHKFRVTDRDVSSSTPIEVVMEPATSRTAIVEVMPRTATISVENGEATRGENGRWSTTVVGNAAAKVKASAPGFVSQTIEAAPDGPPTRILLKASATDWWKHYQSLGPDSALRLVGRVGSFGAGARAVALSSNGKFLAVAEGTRPVRVHIWNVNTGQFVGKVMTNDLVEDDNGERLPNAPPIAIAITNDGDRVALSCFVLSIFDVLAGKEIHKFGRNGTDPSDLPPLEAENLRDAASDSLSSEPSDVLSLSFATDGTKLYSTLRNGRIVVRTSGTNWRIDRTIAAFDAGSENVRITSNGDAATAGNRTPSYWTKESGRSVSIGGRKVPNNPRRWSASPNRDYFIYAPEVQPVGGAPMADPWDQTPPQAVFPIEVRRLPGKESHWDRTISEAFPVQTLELLHPTHIAAIVHRRLGSEANAADSGLRVWNIFNQRIIGDAFIPEMIHSVHVAALSGVLATVGDRQHIVYVWKFSPAGDPDYQYSIPTGWDQKPLMFWSGVGEGNSSIVTLKEIGGGQWKLIEADKESNLRESSRTPWKIVLDAGPMEFHAFNRGCIWVRKRNVNPEHSTAKRPNREGYARIAPSSAPTESWKELYIGNWTASNLRPRLID
jgi:WD40 repeat protein